MDLGEDLFLNLRTRNVLILDDMMASASKETRINELFTEGSHYKILTFIAVNQILFYMKDPTQRRNSHYLVLFKNSIGKQQARTLAQQMYLDKYQNLIGHFKEATEKSYGYLLIDLTPTTPESLRMRTDVFIDMLIKEHKPEKKRNLQRSSREQRTQLDSSCEVKNPTCDTDSSLGSAMASCGLVFDSSHDLQQQIKTWCSENENRKRQLPLDVYEKPLKRSHESFSQMNTE